MNRNRTIKNRNQRGTAFADIAVGAMALVAIALFALDIGTAMASYGINDRACRDAARAAAQGSTQVEAQNLANKIVESYASKNGLISSPQVASVVYNDFGGSPPDGVSPFVTVTTRSTARPIAPFSLFGNGVTGKTFPVAKTYTFPIVKLTVKV